MAIALAFALASAVTNGASAYMNATGNRSSLRYQAGIDRINAQLAEQQAQQALRQGQAQKAQLTHRAGEVKGKQKVALAANGVDMGVGSASELLTSTDLMKELDVQALEMNALQSAWGYRTQASDLRNQAMMNEVNAKNISPTTAAFSSLLGSSGAVAQSWYNNSKAA